MSSLLNLMPDPLVRSSRRVEKHNLVKRFLRQHIWSSQAVLQKVMGLESRQAAHKTLSQMEIIGLVRSHQFNALGGDITLWGITPHGQVMAFDPENESPYSAYFEPSRVSEQAIRHQLDLHNLRLEAEACGWSNWTDGDRLGVLEKSAKRPDALVKDLQGLKLAIEVERTFKTIRRYESILVSYLKMLRAGQISKVVWVSPTQDISDRLKKLITGIKFVIVAGQKVQIDPLKHHANLHFCSYADWPNYLP